MTLACAMLAIATWFNTPTAHAAYRDLTKQQTLYREKLAEYAKALAAYEDLAGPYWKSITEKRSRRRARHSFQNIAANDYVLKQPPVYSGPPKPENPEGATSAEKAVPVVADFLREAKAQFDFVPDTPATENDYKRAYAAAARAAGLTAEQCVRIYAFESGGDGTYDVQAGLEYDVPGARAVSTALGYNQLLGTNSVELLAEAGDEFVSALRRKANAANGVRKDALLSKIDTLKKMIAFSRSVPDRWNAHARLADTPKGIGIHALNLDVDIGPLLQVRKLLTSVEFAKRYDFDAPLSAAELEMMNLTGDGNGFEMVLMSKDLRDKIPTSNFFQRGGYERNPVAGVNNTVAKLIAATNAKMDSEAQLQGAKALAALFEEF
ncbi:hypothetical protein HYPDE_25053 [Hyphomicrobium denitrificans 1NES1]|uniref:Lipoprotein n=2 Tax=Hyphomicrobium denitrificans TaxID=53399 RepID=N0B9E4_9HYPH|nr:hypothetical protein HYPDE_25053 [Hyphomicrobium denitrificans 1NES1]